MTYTDGIDPTVVGTYNGYDASSESAAVYQMFLNATNATHKYGTTTAPTTTELGNWLASYLSSSPKTTESFITSYYEDVLGYPSNAIPTDAYNVTSTTDNDNILKNAFYYWARATGNLIGTNDDMAAISAQDLSTAFTAAFTNFLNTVPIGITTTSTTPENISFQYNNYSYNGVSIVQNNILNLGLAFGSTLGYSALISNSSTGVTTSGSLSTAYFSGTDPQFVQTYQNIYEAFVGDIGDFDPSNPSSWTPAQQTFVNRLNSFYNAEVAKDGSFNVSANLSDFYNYSANLSLNPNYNPAGTTYDADSTAVLNEVLMLLINMIGVIQKVAASQATQLTFLSQWQEAYTNKLNQVHIFASGDGTILQGAGSPSVNTPSSWRDTSKKTPLSNARSAINSINQNYITKLQGMQSNVSDTAKGVQTNVNQSNDAATQQASMADSLLQQMSTIISAIFR